LIISNNPNVRDTIKTDADTSIKMGYIAHFQVSADDAVAENSVGILAATELTTEAQTIATGIINPTISRNLIIVGNVEGITGDVTIKGTNCNGEIITETLALNGSTVVEGEKAFKTVTEIDLPVQTAAGNTVSVGFGEKLGIPYKLAHNTILFAFLDNVKEATDPTLTISSAILENNTIKLNSALSSKIVDIYFIV
jgi:hypothetical protein